MFDRLGYVMKQNMLTLNTTSYLLDKLKPTVVFSGHDHEGCRFLHDGKIQEYTVRSVMADYSGNSAFFEIRQSQAADAGVLEIPPFFHSILCLLFLVKQ
jgi:hypothetical protein